MAAGQFQHDQGRKAVDDELGDKVETVFVENVVEADSDRTIERLARDGCKMIFTTSFGFMEPDPEGCGEISRCEV